MPCYSPLSAYKLYSGEVVFSLAKAGHTYAAIQLACGQCIGCRLERSRQWAMRCMHEASLHKENCFLTITYNDEHVPKGLHKPDIQKFLKRLRWHNQEKKISYYMCGEYGEQTKRPHYHICMFNYRPQDLEYWQQSPSGEKLYKSQTLTETWGKGEILIGEMTFESAAYTARYIMTKKTGKDSKHHYTKIDEKGNMYEIEPEYNDMSRRPGIGTEWYKKYKTDVYPHDYVIVNAMECQPPKFYDELYRKDDEKKLLEIKEKRIKRAQEKWEDNTPPRLHAKMTVTEAKLKFLNRTKA